MAQARQVDITKEAVLCSFHSPKSQTNPNTRVTHLLQRKTITLKKGQYSFNFNTVLLNREISKTTLLFIISTSSPY